MRMKAVFVCRGDQTPRKGGTGIAIGSASAYQRELIFLSDLNNKVNTPSRFLLCFTLASAQPARHTMIADEDTQLPQSTIAIAANSSKTMNEPLTSMNFKAGGLIRIPIDMNANQQMRDADLYRIDNPTTTRSRHDLLRQESNTSMRSIQSLPPQIDLPNHSPRSQLARRDMQSLSSRSLRKLQVQPNFLHQRDIANKRTNEEGTSDLDEDRHHQNIDSEVPVESMSIVSSSKMPHNVNKATVAVDDKVVAAVDKNFQKLSITSAATSTTSTSSTEQSPNNKSEQSDTCTKMTKKAEKVDIINKVITSKSKSKWARLRSVLYIEDGREIMREAATQQNILLTVLAQTPPLDIAEYFFYHCREEAFMERNDRGQTPLHVAATYPSEDSCELVEALLDVFPEAATIQDEGGRTPLMLACSHGKEMDARAIKVLIRASHSSIIAEDEDGSSALEYALLSEVSHKVFLRLQKSHACTMKKIFAKSA